MKRRLELLILIYMVCGFTLLAQSSFTGIIKDTNTGRPLNSCHVSINYNGKKYVLPTDTTGLVIYNFRNTNVDFSIRVSYVGYNTLEKKIELHNDSVVNLFLQRGFIKIKDVDVWSESVDHDGMNLHYFTPKDISLSVNVIGEKDIMRHLQKYPGVSTGMEGSLGIFIRGGNNGNNRIELDGVPIYASTHMYGLLSIFQPEIVKDVAFFMGGISSENGNFLSSVTSVKTKSAFSKSQKSISVSPFIMGASFSMPIVSKKVSLVAGVRYSPINQEYKLIKDFFDMEGNLNTEVVDGFVKLSYNINTKNTINIEAFATNDYLKYSNSTTIEQNWYNTICLINWIHNNSNKIKSKTQISYNKSYNIQRQEQYEDGEYINGLMLSSGIDEYTGKYTLQINNPTISYSLGGEFQYSKFSPASEKIVVSSEKNEQFDQENTSLNTCLFVQTKSKLLDKTLLNIGARGYYYSCSSYQNLIVDPRVNIDYKYNNNIGFCASYDHFSQFYHVLEGLPTGWSLNVSIPASESIVPEECHQFYLGSYWLIKKFHFNLGGYFKKMNNLVSYKNTDNLFGVTAATWDEEMDSGKGSSIGLEFFVKKKGDLWRWNLAYTLSKTDRTFDEINNGETYPFKFDRRHMLNFDTDFFVVKKEHKQQSVYANFIYSTGHHITFQTGKYLGITPPYWSQREESNYIPTEMNTQAYYRQLMSSKNGYTMPNYIRLDVGYVFKWQKRKIKQELAVSIFNVLNRKNPYLYYYDDNQWNQLSIFPLIPSIRYSLEF